MSLQEQVLAAAQAESIFTGVHESKAVDISSIVSKPKEEVATTPVAEQSAVASGRIMEID